MAKKKSKKKSTSNNIVINENAMMQWGNKAFYVTGNSLMSFTNMTVSGSYNVEEKENGKKIPKLEDKHPGNKEISLTVPIRWEFCSNPRGEYEWWDKQLQSGTSSLLYVGRKAFGTNEYKLLSVSLSDVKLTATGEMKAFTMDLTFKETPKSKKKKSSGKSTRKKKK